MCDLQNSKTRFRFHDVQSVVNQKYYSYNPCGAFNEGECTNAAVRVLSVSLLFDKWAFTLREFENNKGTDQPAQQRSLISAFVIRLLESIISKLAQISEVSLF